MYDSFTAQLAGLDLAGFSIQPAPFNETDLQRGGPLQACGRASSRRLLLRGKRDLAHRE